MRHGHLRQTRRRRSDRGVENARCSLSVGVGVVLDVTRSFCCDVAQLSNELDELQTELRKISPETELIWFAFFWIGLGFVDFTNMNPGLSSGNYSLQPSNILLKFFLCSIIFIIIGAVQLAIYGLRNFCSAPKIQQFTDLCSVSNISILIMTE